jgi:hypothetical protein
MMVDRGAWRRTRPRADDDEEGAWLLKLLLVEGAQPGRRCSGSRAAAPAVCKIAAIRRSSDHAERRGEWWGWARDERERGERCSTAVLRFFVFRTPLKGQFEGP